MDWLAYRAKPHTGLINLDNISYYNIDDYWEPVFAHEKRIILDPGAFYILVSREAVHIPPNCAAEMAPYLAMVGEFRVHYAGFLILDLGTQKPVERDLEVSLKLDATKHHLH